MPEQAVVDDRYSWMGAPLRSLSKGNGASEKRRCDPGRNVFSIIPRLTGESTLGHPRAVARARWFCSNANVISNKWSTFRWHPPSTRTSGTITKPASPNFFASEFPPTGSTSPRSRRLRSVWGSPCRGCSANITAGSADRSADRPLAALQPRTRRGFYRRRLADRSRRAALQPAASGNSARRPR